MYRDLIVEEVRKVRREIEAECQRDEIRFYEHLLQVQAKHSDRLVRRRPNPSYKADKTV